jgi:hypothetical protein
MPTRVTSVCAALAALLILPVTHAAPAAGADFKLQDTADQHLDILLDGTLVGRYMYALDLSGSEQRHDTYKPFLHVFDAEGKAPITKGPGGRYTHHRGVFRGWSRLTLDGKKYDTWHMRGVVQKHLEFTDRESDGSAASFTALIRYQTDDGATVLLEEQRATTFLAPPAPAYAMFDVASTVKAVAGTIQLHGDPEHAGLQFRPANEVNASQTVYCFPGKDTDPRKDRDLAWAAESFVIGEQRYTVLYLNHPDNNDGAIFSAYRSYGRFGAWFNGEVPADGEKTTRVRFVVLQGDFPSAEFIQQQYNAFAGTDSPTPETTLRPAK